MPGPTGILFTGLNNLICGKIHKKNLVLLDDGMKGLAALGPIFLIFLGGILFLHIGLPLQQARRFWEAILTGGLSALGLGARNLLYPHVGMTGSAPLIRFFFNLLFCVWPGGQGVLSFIFFIFLTLLPFVSLLGQFSMSYTPQVRCFDLSFQGQGFFQFIPGSFRLPNT